MSLSASRPPPHGPSSLPGPDEEGRARSLRLAARIGAQIGSGDIGFDEYMRMALYEPGLGYYDAQGAKIGAAGDFVTAPGITPLFARTLAAQVAQAFERTGPDLLEFGAGTGDLAAELLAELARAGRPARSYRIVEVSGDLRARQRARLAGRGEVQWLDAMPARVDGVVVANEVLDVLPVRTVVRTGEAWLERRIAVDAQGILAWSARDADPGLTLALQAIESEVGILPAGYASEVSEVVPAWIATLGEALGRALVLVIDYGFPRREYYHPQRAMGTLMCHYRHHAHADPLWMPGLNDITAHVDFSSCAQAARAAGCELLGYTSQARFLLNCGILDQLARAPGEAGAVMRLLSEAEMGELLKVMAFGRGVPGPLLGFSEGDRLHRLL